MRVFVAGTGIICATGNNVQETLLSFRDHRSGIAPLKNLKTRHAGSLPVGQVKLSNEELANLSGLDPALSRTILLGGAAAIQALAGIRDQLPRYRSGLISAGTVAGMDITEEFAINYFKIQAYDSIGSIINHDCGKGTDIIAKLLGVNAYVSTISTACSSSANSIMQAARLIKQNKLDLVIAGGCDALCRFTINGFNSLMILDQQQCKPFDKNRNGLNLGEGAAFLLLISEKLADTGDFSIIAELTGYCNANDAFHATALSPNGEGPVRAMQGALKMAAIKPSEISYINMHGTGTVNNDQSEAVAVSHVFSGDVPAFSSTKSFTGHTLAASGAVEAVFCSQAIHGQQLFPNFNFNEVMPEVPLKPETSMRAASVKHVLSNSFGFGGNCSSLIFTAC